MTMVIAGVGAFGSIQEAQASDKSVANDSAYSLNTTRNDRGDAADFGETGNNGAGKTVAATEDNTMRACHKRHFGFGGGPLPGLSALDVTPVRDLVRMNPYLRDKNFPSFDNERYHAFFSMGGMGYLCVGNGVRLGGGGISCERYFPSDRFAADSAISLSVKAEYGGFIMEKAFRYNDCSFFTGMLIGGGSLKVSYSGIDGNIFEASDEQCETKYGRESSAQFALFEVHGGITYTLVPFVHVGADLSIPMFYSAAGFNAFTAGFTTVNPAISVRLMLGTRE
jgi:hypothetical protein